MNRIITEEQIAEITRALLEIPIAGKYTYNVIKYLEQLPAAPVIEDKDNKEKKPS